MLWKIIPKTQKKQPRPSRNGEVAIHFGEPLIADIRVPNGYRLLVSGARTSLGYQVSMAVAVAADSSGERASHPILVHWGASPASLVRGYTLRMAYENGAVADWLPSEHVEAVREIIRAEARARGESW